MAICFIVITSKEWIASGNLGSNLLLFCKEKLKKSKLKVCLQNAITPDETELLKNLESSDHKGVYNCISL